MKFIDPNHKANASFPYSNMIQYESKSLIQG